MKEFKGKTAVITGGASGLGRAMAERALAEGMQLILADIEEPALARTVGELEAKGGKVIGVPTDVSNGLDVEALADRAMEAFGAVHLLCNNAGVAGSKVAWEATEADWKWELGVNLWGVIHGVRVFTPLMLQQNCPAHIVNTASVAGLICPPGSATYNVTKHAVVALTETLHHDLVARSALLRVSVLCPAYVNTGIGESARNRPTELHNVVEIKSEEQLAREERLKQALQKGRKSAQDVANEVFTAVQEERFYILTHSRIKVAIETRMQDILLDRLPTNPM